MQRKSKQETKKPSDPQTMTQKHTQPAAPNAPVAPMKPNSVPMPEHGAHPHSYAAHLGNPMRAHTAPAAGFKPSGQLREPPQQISRIGKQHRG